MTPKVTLLRAYLRYRGLYARVAKRLRLDPSYVSRVANGQRHSKRISLAIEAELRKIQAASEKIAQPTHESSLFLVSKKNRTQRSKRRL